MNNVLQMQTNSEHLLCTNHSDLNFKVCVQRGGPSIGSLLNKLYLAAFYTAMIQCGFRSADGYHYGLLSSGYSSRQTLYSILPTSIRSYLPNRWQRFLSVCCCVSVSLIRNSSSPSESIEHFKTQHFFQKFI